MVIYGVSFDMVGKQPIVLLKAVDTNKFLPIWIGHPEAAAILMKLQGASTPRPMTHDLLFDASWILTLPLTGGEEFYTSYQPFCGDPQKALRWSSVKVTGTPVA